MWSKIKSMFSYFRSLTSGGAVHLTKTVSLKPAITQVWTLSDSNMVLKFGGWIDPPPDTLLYHLLDGRLVYLITVLRRDVLTVICVLCSPGLLEELSQSSEPLTQCLSVDSGQLLCCCSYVNLTILFCLFYLFIYSSQ